MSQTLITIGLFIIAIALTAFFTALFIESANTKTVNSKLTHANDLLDFWYSRFIATVAELDSANKQINAIIFAVWRSHAIDRNADDVVKWIKEAQKTISDLESQLNVSKITYCEVRLERP